MTYSTTIRRKRHRADSLKALSAIYCRLRDESGEGASTFPMPTVFEDGEPIGYLAYNGRVFPNSPSLSTPGTKPIYDNSVEAEQ